MQNEIRINVSKTLFNRNKREFIINDEQVIYYSEGWLTESILKLETQKVKEIKYGIKWLQGIEFTFGRIYQLFLKDIDNKEIKIEISSFYHNKLNELTEQFNAIIQSVWDRIFSDDIDNYIELFNENIDFQLGGVKISENGISYKSNQLFSEKTIIILWENLEIAKHNTYFSVIDSTDTVNINRGFYYQKDWNALVLEHVLERIIGMIKK